MMGRVAITYKTEEDVTNLSNIFIDEYMCDANDAQIKVYLYLLRQMKANQPTSVSDLADKFNHTEKDVVRALKYWEKMGLISLEYDGAHHLTSIHMEDIVPHKNNHKAISVAERTENIVINATGEDTQASAPVIEKRAPKKPNYSASELKAFQQDDSCSQLLYIAEMYFGRTLNPTDMRTILFIHDELQFSDELLDYLMQYCAGSNHKDFRYLEQVAIRWSESGITTPDQARLESSKYTSDIRDIFTALGIAGANPAPAELAFIQKWYGQFGFSKEVILEACKRTVLKTTTNRLNYCDKILANWHSNNVKTLEDIKKLDGVFNASNAAKNARLNNVSKFNQFPSRTYDMDALEQQLLEN